MVIARYTAKQGVVAQVERLNGELFLLYDPEGVTCMSGPFKNLTAAEKALSEKGLAPKRMNEMCNRCIRRDCIGTANMVWTGCVNRQIAARA